MLKNLNPLLTPELLSVLAEMGHGDDLVLCDANFPAESVARTTAHGRPIRLVGVDAPAAARAILSVLPLDEFVEVPVSRMEVAGEPQTVPAVQQEVQMVVDAALGRCLAMGPVERFAFYELARSAYAVVATGERRFWGCFVFKKGVVPPDSA
ncbi:MAG TPA: RbsD/FucU domain-containing protein [Gaiellaceae bacterium]|nr:RbsD/FucU domain-containing protein [Gaiellaceae bacterium]